MIMMPYGWILDIAAAHRLGRLLHPQLSQGADAVARPATLRSWPKRSASRLAAWIAEAGHAPAHRSRPCCRRSSTSTIYAH